MPANALPVLKTLFHVVLMKRENTAYKVICANIVVDSDRCIYHINSSYLASYIKVKYHKK